MLSLGLLLRFSVDIFLSSRPRTGLATAYITLLGTIVEARQVNVKNTHAPVLEPRVGRQGTISGRVKERRGNARNPTTRRVVDAMWEAEETWLGKKSRKNKQT